MLLLYIVFGRDHKSIWKSKRRKASSVYATFTKWGSYADGEKTMTSVSEVRVGDHICFIVWWWIVLYSAGVLWACVYDRFPNNYMPRWVHVIDGNTPIKSSVG